MEKGRKVEVFVIICVVRAISPEYLLVFFLKAYFQWRVVFSQALKCITLLLICALVLKFTLKQN